MKLTLERHPEAIKRYAHIKPARRGGKGRCFTRCRGTPHSCTLGRGHRGPHVAHGMFKKVVAVWEQAATAEVADARPSRTSGGWALVGLRAGRPTSLIEVLWSRAVRTISSVEELAFLILFLAFVGFAIHWLRLIL